MCFPFVSSIRVLRHRYKTQKRKCCTSAEIRSIARKDVCVCWTLSSIDRRAWENSPSHGACLGHSSNGAAMMQLRDPGVVMAPDTLGALQPTRFSASRTLMNKMVQERWVISRPEFDVDSLGEGSARYHVSVNDDWSFEFVVFSNAPKEGVERTDRI